MSKFLYIRIYLAVAFCFLLFHASVYGNCNNLVTMFDKNFYYPEDMKVEDLVFNVKLSDLAKILNEEKVFGNIKDVYFTVLWTIPQTYKVVVHGLPDGFEERKEQLRQLVIGRLDFVFPQKLGPRLRSYTVEETKKEKNGHVLCTFVDAANVRYQNRVKVLFDSSGRLKSFFVSSPGGTTEALSTLSYKPWSQKRWVLDNLVVNTVNIHGHLTVIKHNIEYGIFSEIGFPVKIKADTTFKVDGKQQEAPEIKSEIIFYDYVINTGKAKKEINADLEQLKKTKGKP